MEKPKALATQTDYYSHHKEVTARTVLKAAGQRNQHLRHRKTAVCFPSEAYVDRRKETERRRMVSKFAAVEHRMVMMKKAVEDRRMERSAVEMTASERRRERRSAVEMTAVEHRRERRSEAEMTVEELRKGRRSTAEKTAAAAGRNRNRERCCAGNRTL